MEAQEFLCLRRIITALPHPRRARVRFSDKNILLVYVWAVLHDRPVYWACDVRNWPDAWAMVLPDDSTMSRRMRSVSVLQLLDRLHQAICGLFALATMVKHVDSFPFPVGSYSHDIDTRRGRCTREMARGYKLHAACVDRVIAVWTLMPMSVNDQVAAPQLFARLRGVGYITADNGYDANATHLAASSCQHQLLAPPRNCNSDRRVRDLKQQRQRNCRQRLQALDMLDSPLRHAGAANLFGRTVHRQRLEMEQTLGQLRLLCLGTLPTWVRRPHRVAPWLAVKIILLNLRSARRRGKIKSLVA